MQLHEYDRVAQLAGDFDRHPGQLNPLFGADSELLKLSFCDEWVIALTTDGIIEEIAQGLYQDPFLIGWMTVMINLSDLAAVGARAEGILVQLSLPDTVDKMVIEGIGSGIRAACSVCDTFVLGGDMNHAAQLSTSGTAIGVVPKDEHISRIGCTPGDLLFSTGAAGLGTAFAFGQVFEHAGVNVKYQPVARLKEGEIIRRYASACLDTSDGLIPGLAQLAEVNDVGFALTESYSAMLHPAAQQLATETELPKWIMMAGPHGDFELVFSVPPENVSAFQQAAATTKWTPTLLGSVTDSGLLLDVGSRIPARIEAWMIANLFEESGGDPEKYLDTLNSFHQHMQWHTR